MKVTRILHCCKPIGIIKEGVKHIIPSCDPVYDKCDGGGRKQLDLLTTEARVWWYFKSSKSVMDAWFTYHLYNTYDHETTKWTVHFCNPAFMRNEGTTQAWPTCDPFQKECNGGKFPHEIIKRYEWACFNAHKRAQVGYGGITFNDWVKVKFGNIQLNKQIEIQYRDEWAKVKFGHMKDLYSNPMIDPAFWNSGSPDANIGSRSNPPNH